MLSFRSRHTGAFFVGLLLLASPFLVTSPFLAGRAVAQAAAAKPAKELSVGQSAARERQKKCGAEWRALSVADKAAQGPKWPQYYSKCVKRLKRMLAQ